MGTFPYHFKHSFGHGSDGLANLLALLNLLAFTFHCVLDCLCALWRRAQRAAGNRHKFFREVKGLTRHFLFAHWTALWRRILHPKVRPG